MAEVLLLEDENNISFVIETVLNDEGHNVFSASNGIAGMERLSLQKPDIILLDLNLPGLNGREIAKKIKADAEWKDIPIVIMSGCVEFSNNFPPKECYDAVLTKPFDLLDLILVVNQLTSKTNFKGLSSTG